MALDDLAATPKPETRPADPLRGIKRLEYAASGRGRYTAAGVGDGDLQSFTSGGPVCTHAAA
jgi:hypothetical protein